MTDTQQPRPDAEQPRTDTGRQSTDAGWREWTALRLVLVIATYLLGTMIPAAGLAAAVVGAATQHRRRSVALAFAVAGLPAVYTLLLTARPVGVLLQ